MDFLTKTLIGEYSYTDVNKDRSSIKRVLINGRKYLKTGTKTATTLVAFQYKVFNPSINRSEYITLIGVARQHNGDTKVSLEEGYEIAATNAMVSPVVTLKFPVECSEYTITQIMRNYVNELPINFIKTKEELLQTNNDIISFSRSSESNSELGRYYLNYYKDMIKKNMIRIS